MMFPGVRVCDTHFIFPLGVENETSYSKRDLSAYDRNSLEVECGCANWRCCWHPCTTFVFLITFTHAHPVHISPNIYCGRSVLNCYLVESAPENHQSQHPKQQPGPD